MDQRRELALLPPGVRVYLPRESRKKRRIIDDLFREAHGWNCQELDLPTLDYYESITQGVSEDLARRTYQFHDDEGELLALRPDATAQIAKILSGRFPPDQIPGRYCYACRNFRAFELRRGELREFHQFGVEILGERTRSSDLELLLFMLEQIENMGLEDVIIDLGHVRVYQGLVQDVELSVDESRELWKKIHRKNLPGLRTFLENVDLPDERKEMFLALPSLYGGKDIFDEFRQFDRVPTESLEALDYLEYLFDRLRSAGFGDYISVDLGVVRGLDYYTGMVFEALLPGLGKPIAGGGRYDDLYGTYGVPMPATGFALEIDRLLPVVDGDPDLPEQREVWCPDPTPEARKVLRDWRGSYRLSVTFDDPPSGAGGWVVNPDGSAQSLAES